MDDAPPYSPIAAASERRLPNDYYAHIVEDEDETLMRPKPPSTDTRHRPSPSLVSSQSSNLLEDHSYAQRPVATAPPTSLFPPEPPPDYAPVDALASSFRLDGPLVYATKTSNTPRYQLMQEFTRSGKPRKLSIRRLLPSETRSGSLLSSSLDTGRMLRYDEDGTMYTITSYEMRGHRSSTLTGSIKLETGKTVLGGKWAKIWLYTKSARRDSLNPDNERRIAKYGYHADDEWDKRLLFVMKRGHWEDGEGKRVAFERGGEFEVLGEVSGPRRDLLVSCWVLRLWMGEGLRWEDDLKAFATRRITEASSTRPLLSH